MLSSAYEMEPLDDLCEQEMFLSILFHDARGGNAIRVLMDKKKKVIKHYASKNLKKIEYRSSEYNAYVTVNTFVSYSRKAEKVYNLSGFYIDLDNHSYKTTDELDKSIEKTKKRLVKAFLSKEISIPTLICETGRGLAIYYILKTSIANTPSAEKAIKYFDDIYIALMDKYRQILLGKGYLEVDSSVKDKSRFCRLPLTYNHAIDRWCRLIHISYNDEDEVKYYTLKELAEDNHLFCKENKISATKREIVSCKAVSLGEYKLPFLTLRLQQMELLQKLRQYDCIGYRDNMVFVYYNAATQIHGDIIGKEEAKSYNLRFNDPLPDQELARIFKGVDNNVAPLTKDYEGYYRISDSWIKDVLKVTDEENKLCRFGSSKRQIERRQIKEKNAMKRNERNVAIAETILNNPKLTYVEIAALFGIDAKTVQRIAKQHHVNRYKKGQ